MRLQWSQDLDIDTLEARGHWATMEELLQVVTFHLPHFEDTVKTCKNCPGQVNPSDLTFATRFVLMYLFIKLKGPRPMTYQYLTVDMVSAAKENGGFIDQKMFKTAGKYGFDSLILTDASMQVLNNYISFVRPLLNPRCDYVLVTRNGGQHSKLGEVMSKLLFGAIGKYVHPVRYRQIVETQSLNPTELQRADNFVRRPETVLRSQKFTIKRSGRAKLLSRVTNVYKNFKEARVQRWTRTFTLDLVFQSQPLQRQLKTLRWKFLPKRQQMTPPPLLSNSAVRGNFVRY